MEIYQMSFLTWNASSDLVGWEKVRRDLSSFDYLLTFLTCNRESLAYGFAWPDLLAFPSKAESVR
jgi:hypothetical protein